MENQRLLIGFFPDQKTNIVQINCIYHINLRSLDHLGIHIPGPMDHHFFGRTRPVKSRDIHQQGEVEPLKNGG